MNNQEVLDKVANHLLKQGKKAKEGIRCQYRNVDGLKCAVGCLIPDEEYNWSLEGRNIGYNSELRALPCMQDMDFNFLTCLQIIHDSCDPTEWQAQLTQLAENHRLQINF